MATRIEPILTIADLEVMPEDGNRYELIEGELFVSRSPSLAHQTVMTKLPLYFGNYLNKHPIGFIMVTPGVLLSEYNAVIPDFIFVSNERRAAIATGERISGAPDLVAEILSPGAENERRDRIAKLHLYGKYGVKEYWILDPATRTIEVYRLQKRGLKLMATFQESAEVTSALLPGFHCPVADLFEY